MTTKQDLDNILRKVQLLLAQANHPNTSTIEADTFRAKAEAMMYRYKLDEAMFAETEGITLLPEWRTFPLCNMGNEFAYGYFDIGASVLQHTGCKGVRIAADKDGVATYFLKCVGYEADLRYAEVLFTAAALAFSARLEPKNDPTLSLQVNAYLMRKAGMEGRRIAEALYGRDDKHLRPKVRGMFKAESIARGEDPSALLGKGVNVKQYREDYAKGFVNELWHRLRLSAIDKGEQATGLVLVGRDEAVLEAYYTEFPQYRPMKNPAGRIGNGSDTCAKCAKAKSGYCRDHSYLRPRASRGNPAFNAAGYAAGQSAARTVDLGTAQGKLDQA